MAITSNGAVPYVGCKALVRMLMDSDAPHALYVAYGTGSTAVTRSDYRMENEAKRELADSITRTTWKLQLINTFAAVTEDIDVWEIGVFTAMYGGEMIYHAVMAGAISLVAETEDQFKPTIQLSVLQGS